MRDYKKEYQNRLKNKKELRCYISLDDYKSLENRLQNHEITPNKWLKLIAEDIIHDGFLHDKILKQIEILETNIQYETRTF